MNIYLESFGIFFKIGAFTIAEAMQWFHLLRMKS